MSLSLSAFLVALPVFLALDAIWLGVVMKRVYKQKLGFLLRDKPDMRPAALFYMLFVIGIVVFAVLPAYNANHSLEALVRGATFGLIAYATYDLTNQATVKRWPTAITVLDMAWGAVISGITALITALVLNGLR